MDLVRFLYGHRNMLCVHSDAMTAAKINQFCFDEIRASRVVTVTCEIAIKYADGFSSRDNDAMYALHKLGSAFISAGSICRRLRLKVGARILLTSVLNVDGKRIPAGAVGCITALSLATSNQLHSVRVAFDNFGETEIPPRTWKLLCGKFGSVNVTQYPLVYGWCVFERDIYRMKIHQKVIALVDERQLMGVICSLSTSLSQLLLPSTTTFDLLPRIDAKSRQYVHHAFGYDCVVDIVNGYSIPSTERRQAKHAAKILVLEASSEAQPRQTATSKTVALIADEELHISIFDNLKADEFMAV